MQQLRSSYAVGSCPIPKILGSASHAFLAASLREALASSKYASRTNIVPGEADDSCALHAKDIARTVIFTSDTDLLLYKYHAETVIVFFQHADVSAAMTAHSPYQISQKMQLDSLLPLAYLLNERFQEDMDDTIKTARTLDLQDAGYLEFTQRYALAVEAPLYLEDQEELAAALQISDARVSEFIHQALAEYPTISVYLPLLVEDPNLASAYNLGLDIRRLAYSLLVPSGAVVQEYKRKAQGISSDDIDSYASAEIGPLAAKLEARVDGLLDWANSKQLAPALFWQIFALSFVVSELNTPAPLQNVMRVLNNDFNLTWEFVHLTSRMQAVLYSLRILKQVVAVWLALPQQAQMPFQRDLSNLHKHFSTFPPIAELFGVPGQTKRVLTDDNTLADLIVEMYKSVGVEVPLPMTPRQHRNKRRNDDRKKRKSEQRQQKQQNQSGGNAFSVLQNDESS